jgi:hypothetical protein
MGSQPKTEMTADTGSGAFSTSELRKLSSDPAITKHPDPKFQIRFTDPDELGDEEPFKFEVNFTASPRRADPTSSDWRMRRSPKE